MLLVDTTNVIYTNQNKKKKKAKTLTKNKGNTYISKPVAPAPADALAVSSRETFGAPALAVAAAIHGRRNAF